MLWQRFHGQISLSKTEYPYPFGNDVAEMSGHLKKIITMTDKADKTIMELTEEIMTELDLPTESDVSLIHYIFQMIIIDRGILAVIK